MKDVAVLFNEDVREYQLESLSKDGLPIVVFSNSDLKTVMEVAHARCRCYGHKLVPGVRRARRGSRPMPPMPPRRPSAGSGGDMGDVQATVIAPSADMPHTGGYNSRSGENAARALKSAEVAIELYTKGMTTKDVASYMRLSVKTIRRYIRGR